MCHNSLTSSKYPIIFRLNRGDNAYVIEEFAHRNGELSSPRAIPSLSQMVQTEARALPHLRYGTVLYHLIQNAFTARQIEEISDLRNCCCVVLVHVFVLKEQMSIWVSLKSEQQEGREGGYEKE